MTGPSTVINKTMFIIGPSLVIKLFKKRKIIGSRNLKAAAAM